MRLELRPPHINYSRAEFTVNYSQAEPALYMGLNQVRDLTRRTMQRVLRERPFHSLQDFLTRVDPRPQEIENLVRVGALADLGSIPAFLRELKAGVWKPGQFTLFETPLSTEDDWPLAQKVAAQEELLGASVTAQPLELVADRIARS